MTKNRVFISYSHDSPEHTQRVLALANRLRADGIEAWIDQYVQDPDEGWIHWMRSQIKQANRVLLVFTETYQRRFEGDEEEGKGRGATFEGVIVTQALYESGGRNAKFRPLVFREGDERFIPLELLRFNRYRVDTPENYKVLLRWLHEAPDIVAPPVGVKPDLPEKPISELFPSKPVESEYLYNTAVQLQDPKDVGALVRQLKQLGEPAYYGPLLRRLDPIVFINRSESLAQITRFFEDSTVSVLYMMGLPAVGKSTLVRGALELRRTDTPAVWMTCEGLDAQQLLAEINAGLHLDANAILGDSDAHLAKKIASVFGSIKNPSILVLDGFEALLDASDKFSSAGMTGVFEALVTLEHKAKVLVTARRLLYGVGEGSAGVQIMRLGGLSEPMAEALFQTRAQLTPEQSQALLSKDVLQKLRGHPKFIELLASAITELPAQQVVTALLQASDIGSFVIGQVFGQMAAAELQLLRAALVFRGAFTFDALNAVHSAVNSETHTITQLVRILLRRAVFEPVADPQIAYYLHPILRDAVPREPGQEAAAHAAAAQWFLRTPFDPSDLTTWDDGLYLLRRAAEVGRDQANFQAYKDFVFESEVALSYAGWERRVLHEFEVLYTIAQVPSWDKFHTLLLLGNKIYECGEISEAVTVFRELTEMLTNAKQGTSEENEPAEFISLLGITKTNLGQALLAQGNVEQARKLAKEVASAADASLDVRFKFRHRSLCFSLARKDRNQSEMLRLATECFQLAEQWFQESPSPETQNVLAGAHGNLAVSYIYQRQVQKVLEHFGAKLQIYLEIGRIVGVMNTLFDLGTAAALFDPVSGGAMLLTYDQIAEELGRVKSKMEEERANPTIRQFLSDRKNIEQGRAALTAISDKLLPYYQRSLKRRLGETAA